MVPACRKSSNRSACGLAQIGDHVRARQRAPINESLANAVLQLVGLTAEVTGRAIRSALEELESIRLRHTRGIDLLNLTQTGSEVIRAASTQHDAVRSSFAEQTLLDLRAKWQGANDDSRRQAVDLAVRTLVEIFDERGVELVNAVLGGGEVAEGGRQACSPR